MGILNKGIVTIKLNLEKILKGFQTYIANKPPSNPIPQPLLWSEFKLDSRQNSMG
jgi:hypothetical protein